MRLKFLTHLLTYFIYSCAAVAQDKEASQYAELRKEIKRYLNPLVTTNNFSGSVLVSYKDTILFDRSFGYANREFGVKNNSSTKYHIASISKLFTAAAILILEDRGQIHTGDHLNKYLPDFPNGDKIRIHDLLAHSSGIININDIAGYDSLAMFPQTPQSLVDFIKDRPLDFPPGTKFSYSNTNYNVLALLIEKISGKKYEVFLDENIFRPLGMASTGCDQNARSIIENLAYGYQSDRNFGLDRSAYLNWSAKTGNGSVYTTTGDLLKFNRALDNNTLLSLASKAKMFTSYMGNVGYGNYMRPLFDKPRHYMSGRSPGFTSMIGEFPEDRLVIIVLENLYIPTATQAANDIAAIFFKKPYNQLTLSNDTPDNDLIRKAAGRYQFDSSFFAPNLVLDVTQDRNRLKTSSGELLFIKGRSFMLRTFWGLIDFQQDKNGNISGLQYDHHFTAKRLNKRQ